MTLNRSSIDSDASNVLILAENVNAGDPDLRVRAGAFHGAAEERRVFFINMETDDIPAKTFNLRVVLEDPRFPDLDLTGKPRPVEATAPIEPG